MAFKACTRCQGTLAYEQDVCALGTIWVEHCLNCGRRRDLNWKPDPKLSREPSQIAQGTYADDAKI